MITYHFAESIGKFSDPEYCSVAGIVPEGENIAKTWLFKRWRV